MSPSEKRDDPKRVSRALLGLVALTLF
ncbi:MAG: hypothetical protein QOG16_1749, partial [Actinomycetota bacterium]|nr:hypothetical protein [Actinomycetota bacterium]